MNNFHTTTTLFASCYLLKKDPVIIGVCFEVSVIESPEDQIISKIA
jgi:hypothetical protein